MKRLQNLFLLSGILMFLTMNTSASQLNKLKDTEGFSAKAYLDPPGNSIHQYSIGYGHQIRPNESNLLTMSISTDTASALLRSDIAPLESQINKTLKVVPTQNQFDALIDFGYNCGDGALAKVITTWNTTKDTTKVTAEIAAYNKVHNGAGVAVVDNDLVARRSEEISLFNSSLSPTAKKVISGTFVLAALAGVVLLSRA